MASSNDDNKQFLTFLTLDSNNAIKNLMATIVNLNGTNYFLWVQSFKLFIGAQRKVQYLIDDLPNFNDLTYEDWLASDCCVMS